uniref:Uncharacterized protein n=1 Tax=Lepeophtheirus salmonis TaxID=72036 RepID=A0A0K2UNQ8_LEPSM
MASLWEIIPKGGSSPLRSFPAYF